MIMNRTFQTEKFLMSNVKLKFETLRKLNIGYF